MHNTKLIHTISHMRKKIDRLIYANPFSIWLSLTWNNCFSKLLLKILYGMLIS